MNHRWLARIGAVAAVTGALAQVTATVLEPERADDSVKAIRTIAGSGIWTLDRVIDLVGLFLAVGALAVVGRTFTGRPGRDWVRVGQPFLAMLGALGASAILTGATLKDVADAWAAAGPSAKPAHLAVFDAVSQTTDAFFFCAFVVMGLYLATLAGRSGLRDLLAGLVVQVSGLSGMLTAVDELPTREPLALSAVTALIGRCVSAQGWPFPRAGNVGSAVRVVVCSALIAPTTSGPIHRVLRCPRTQRPQLTGRRCPRPTWLHSA